MILVRCLLYLVILKEALATWEDLEEDEDKPVREKIDYCRSDLKMCAKPNVNFMCKQGSTCDEHFPCKVVHLLKKEKDFLLDALNTFRSTIAMGNLRNLKGVSAADMHALSWDEELAYLSQCHANRCTFKSENCLMSHKFGRSNNWVITQSRDASDDYLEFCNFTTSQYLFQVAESLANAAAPASYDFKRDGIFGKVALGKDTAVGCAMAKTTRWVDMGGINLFVFVLSCTWSYSAFTAKPLFTVGPACTKCQKGLPCNSEFPGLCGRVMYAERTNYDALFSRSARIDVTASSVTAILLTVQFYPFSILCSMLF